MSDSVKFNKGCIPTVLSFDLESNDFIIGDEAKKGGIKGVTSAYNFKKVIGEADGSYKKPNQFWISPDGGTAAKNSKVLSAEDVTEHFLSKILSRQEMPDQIIIGIPCFTESNWISNYKKHVNEALKKLGYPTPKYYWEPFAVFQSFKEINKKLDFKSKAILVIDIGGSTFNSCIVYTTNEGTTSEGGANAIPVGIHSSFKGGNFIDKKLLLRWIADNKAITKEDPENILQGAKSRHYLYEIEELKVELSQKYSSSRLRKDEKVSIISSLGSESYLAKDFPNGEHSLTAETLLDVTRKAIESEWLPQLHRTITDAKASLLKSKKVLKEIDYAVIAGGSSQLPILKEELVKVLAHKLVSKNNVFSLSENGYSVAQGLAIIAREQATKSPDLILSKNARCIVGDLFLGVRSNRTDDYQFPKIVSDKTIEKGAVLNGASELKDCRLIIDLELPSIPRNIVHFSFFNTKDDAAANNLLNAPYDVHNLDKSKKFTKKAKLFLEIQNDEFISAKIILETKKNKESVKLLLGDFDIGAREITDGDKFIGFDFGNSNCYVAEFVSPISESGSFIYPEFELNNSTTKKLIELDDQFDRLKAEGIIDSKKVKEIAKEQIMSAVYHSNKIEANPLSYGQTKEIIENPPKLIETNDEQEVKNLAECYEWLYENYEEFYNNPLRVIKYVNELIMRNIKKDAGAYRIHNVSIEGAEIIPPEPYDIALHMEALSKELKSGKKNRSFLEFACAMHTKFVYIHPFSDGNGRTARILLDAILLNESAPPIVIKSDEKLRYIDSLIESNKGNINPFMDLYIDTMISLFIKLRKDFNNKGLNAPISENKDVYGIVDSQDSPLNCILENLSNKKIIDKLKLFDVFYSECESFKKTLENLFQTSSDQSTGIRFNLKEFGSFSDQTFSEILSSRESKYFWYFSFSIHMESHEKTMTYIFSIGLDDESDSGVSLFLGKGVDGFKILETDPVRLRKMILKGERLVMVDHQRNVDEVDYDYLLNKLIAEILHFYFLD